MTFDKNAIENFPGCIDQDASRKTHFRCVTLSSSMHKPFSKTDFFFNVESASSNPIAIKIQTASDFDEISKATQSLTAIKMCILCTVL